MNNDIEKANARQVGDIHPNGKWVWTKLSSGKYDWRGIKSGNGKSSGSSGGGQKSSSQTTSTKVTSQTGIITTSKSGKPMSVEQLEVWVTKASEDKLLMLVNSKNGKPDMRKLAYDELEKRGFDMSKVDTSGTLGRFLKHTTSSNNNVTSTSATDIDDDPIVDDTDEPIEEDWMLDRNNKEVQRLYKKLGTKSERIRYDKDLDEFKRARADYEPPPEILAGLAMDYWHFLTNPKQTFMISSGGAGVGKSYLFNEMAEAGNFRQFDESVDVPGDGDYDWVELGSPRSAKQFQEQLKEHNGKLLVFDDADKILTNEQYNETLKKAAGGGAGKRMVRDPDDAKKSFNFTGKILVMTNKSMSDMIKTGGDDFKAVYSRANLKPEVSFTLSEQIENLENIIFDMKWKSQELLDDADEDKKERQLILTRVKENIKRNRIDPDKFSARSIEDALSQKRKIEEARETVKQSPIHAKRFAPLANKNIIQAIDQALMKAGEYNILSQPIDEDIIFKAYEQSVTAAEDLLFNKGVVLPDKTKTKLEKAETLLFE